MIERKEIGKRQTNVRHRTTVKADILFKILFELTNGFCHRVTRWKVLAELADSVVQGRNHDPFHVVPRRAFPSRRRRRHHALPSMVQFQQNVVHGSLARLCEQENMIQVQKRKNVALALGWEKTRRLCCHFHSHE